MSSEIQCVICVGFWFKKEYFEKSLLFKDTAWLLLDYSAFKLNNQDIHI